MTVNRALTVTTATDCATEISSISEGDTTRAVNPDVRLTEDQKLQLLEKIGKCHEHLDLRKKNRI